uniref:Tripartite motif-containing protein 59 n=1 Tax=Leptobrachium leishanense TaxID=445787 RepID=A0A8C5PTG1_9ANUR
MDNFEEELTCSVCYNIFDDPRILPCSHTFCRSCLENVINSLDSLFWRLSLIRLKCPSCRNVTELSTGGVHALPINFALKSIIEKYRTEEHQSMATCPEHYRQPLNVFCLTDRKLVCGHCLTVGQHQGHPIDDPQSAYIKERETASKLLVTLSDKNFTGASSVIKALEEQMAHCKRVIQEDKQEVLTFFKKISDVLENKKQCLLASLNEVNQQASEVYAPQIEKMKQIEDEQLDLISLCSSTEQESSPLAFLEKVHAIKQRMKMLKKQQLQPVRLAVIDPRVGQVLRSEWMDTTLGEVHSKPIPIVKIYYDRDNPKSKANSILTYFVLVVIVAALLFLCLWNIDSWAPFETKHMKQWLSENLYSLAVYFCSDLHRVNGFSYVFQDFIC